MAETRWAAGAAFALCAVLGLSACGRPTGDFGRVEPSVLHDEILPTAGRLTARARGEAVSDFAMTDDERTLRARSFAFVRAPHVRDWWFDTLAEGERTRLLPALSGEGGPSAEVRAFVPEALLPLLGPAYDRSRYHRFLIADPYRSSEGRWNRVIADMTGDALLVPPFCAVAARVRRTDAERLAVLARGGPYDAAFAAAADARVSENQAVTSWVWRALRHRLGSYRHAIDRLSVETPSDRLYEANRTFAALAAARCADAPALDGLALTEAPRTRRISKDPDPFDEPVLQK